LLGFGREGAECVVDPSSSSSANNDNLKGECLETSYHLSGTEVTDREDDVLRRQRRYRRGGMMGGASSSRGGGSRGKKRGDISGGGRGAATTTTAAKSSSSPPSSGVVTTIDAATFDGILVSAFRSMVYLPPSPTGAGATGATGASAGTGTGDSPAEVAGASSFLLPSPDGSASLRNVDVASRRRLDRRTLYHGLMAELGGGAGASASTSASAANKRKDEGGRKRGRDNSVDSMIRRRYLDPDTARSLKGALGLACQPKWREKLATPTTTSAAATADVAGTRDDADDDAAVADGDEVGEENDDDGDDEACASSAAAMPTWWHRGGVCLFPQGNDAPHTLEGG